MINRAAARSALIEQLRARSSKPIDDAIPDQTDIYRDLNINGQDLWEVFAWVSATYGTDCSLVTPQHYDVSEPPGRWLNRTRFKGVTIIEILDAIAQGRWSAPG